MVPYNTDICVIAAAFYVIGRLGMKKRKRKKPWLERQRMRHSHIMSLLETDDLTKFIDSDSFDELLKMVRLFITKRDTIMSRSVTAEECLIATLLFLAGNGYQELKNKTLLCPQLLAKIIPETCSAIFIALGHYIKMPSTEEEWKAIAKTFEEKWQFNNCIGCLDARHILIQKPSVPDSSDFINHEGTHSVICVAAVNANHEFIYVESGLTGNYSSTLLAQCNKLILKLIDDELTLPESCPLPGSDQSVPYTFIGNGFWPVDINIMSPYLGERLSEAEKIFNYRLFRASTANNAFGILKTKFGVFNRAIDLECVDKLVVAACALHNFLIKKPCYMFPNALDVEDTTNGTFKLGDWRSLTTQLLPITRVKREPWNDGIRVRNDLTEYFNTVGRVPFQDEMVNLVPCIEPVPSKNAEWNS